jgi:hypothetical protein
MHGYDDIILFISYDLQVTMEWWTHLWLNEGFATWIEYLCVDHTHPDYDIWTNFLSLEYAVAMNLDALANSHPIEVSHSIIIIVISKVKGTVWESDCHRVKKMCS